MVAALLGLLLVASFSTVTVHSILRQHRRQKTRMTLVQSRYLAQSAIERAVARLRQNADYTGEEWQIAAGEINSRDSATVSIEVSNDKNKPEQRSVSVVARWPANSDLPSLTRKQILIDLNKLGN